MTDDLAPRRAPVKGGGRCDLCGWRTWRHTMAGWRHEACEPPGYWIRKAMLRSHAYGRGMAAMMAPRRPEPVPGCRGCCQCRGRA